MRLIPTFLVLALCAQLAAPAAPACAAATAPARTPALVAAPAAPASAARHRRSDTAAHIRIGCAVLPREAPRPIVVIIPSITVVVISVCWNPQDIVRLRRA